MNKFEGFPVTMQFTPIPNIFINQFANEMNIEELRCMLCFFSMLYSKKGNVRYVTQSEFLSNATLASCYGITAESLHNTIQKALTSAVVQKLLLHVEMKCPSNIEHLYFLNTPSNKQISQQLLSGDLKLPSNASYSAVPEINTHSESKNIFSIYEDNIGLLTPIIYEEINDALKHFSEEWITDAVREAVNANKRNWRYIYSILERWNSEGKKDGKNQHVYAKHSNERQRPGKYEHLIQR